LSIAMQGSGMLWGSVPAGWLLEELLPRLQQVVGQVGAAGDIERFLSIAMQGSGMLCDSVPAGWLLEELLPRLQQVVGQVGTGGGTGGSSREYLAFCAVSSEPRMLTCRAEAWCGLMCSWLAAERSWL
jgi:predicted Rdx family selenoprotein